MKWLIVALQVAVVVTIICRGAWKLRFFAIFIAADIPLTLSYRPEIDSWWYGVLQYSGPAYCLLRVAATAEALLLVTEGWSIRFLRAFLAFLCIVATSATIILWFSGITAVGSSQCSRFDQWCMFSSP